MKAILGPLMTYMAACDTTCDKFDAATAKWFKIDESGRKSNGDWTQQDISAYTPITSPSSHLTLLL